MDKENNYLQYYSYQELIDLSDVIFHCDNLDKQSTELFYTVHEEINRREKENKNSII